MLKEKPAFSIIQSWKGGMPMQIEVKIDSSCKEPKVILMAASMTEEVNDILGRLTDQMRTPQVITGIRNDKVEIVEPADLIRVYANAGKVFAVTSRGEYTLRLRLYEIEERLPPGQFVRISNSEIINLKHVNNFDLSFTGTICVRLSDKTTTYVSRRYVARIKKILGI